MGRDLASGRRGGQQPRSLSLNKQSPPSSSTAPSHGVQLCFRHLEPIWGTFFFFGGSLENYYIKKTKERKNKIISSAQKSFYPFNLAKQRIFKHHSAVKSVLMPPTFHTPPPFLLQPFCSLSSPHPPPHPAVPLLHHPPGLKLKHPSVSKHEDPINTHFLSHIFTRVFTHTYSYLYPSLKF